MKFFGEYQMQPLQPTKIDPELEAQGKGNGQGGSSGGNGTSMDIYDISDPVDIFNKFNEAWCDKVKALSKW